MKKLKTKKKRKIKKQRKKIVASEIYANDNRFFHSTQKTCALK